MIHLRSLREQLLGAGAPPLARYRYGFAVANSVLLIYATFVLREVTPHTFTLYHVSVILTTWYGGFGPGILSALLAFLFDLYYFVPPPDTLLLNHLSDGVPIFGFAAFSILNCTLVTLLHRARLAAVRYAQEKSQLVANMSHEIRTPLNTIMGMLTLMEETRPSDEQRDYLVHTRAAASHLLSLIDDILDFSKAECGKILIDSLDFDLSAEIRACIELVAVKLEAKGLSLRLTLDPALPSLIRGDKKRVRQILVNLLDNAVKFTSQGGIAISVTRLGTDGKRSQIGFEVKDTGIGITPDRIKDIFLPFVQGDRSTTRRYGGSGLGLAICKHLVEALGGEIGVSSEPGSGSRFWVHLPLQNAHVVSPASEQAAPVRVDTIGTPRILLVEDNSMNQLVTLKMLQKLGCQVDVAASGTEAVQAVSECHYDLVFMDCHMPEMDGYEATRRIRKLSPPAGEVPVVALTAFAMRTNEERCLKAGMNDYLAKPFDPESLRERLHRWLGMTLWLPPPVPPSPPLAPQEGARVKDGIDYQVLDGLRFCENGDQLLDDVITAYLTNAPTRLGILREAVSKGDKVALERAAHTMKSASAILGAKRVVEICGELEGTAEPCDRSRAEGLVRSLSHELAGLEKKLNLIRGTLGPPEQNHCGGEA